MSGEMTIAIIGTVFLVLCTLWLDLLIVVTVLHGVINNKHYFILFLLLFIPNVSKIGVRAVMRVIPGTTEYERVFGATEQTDTGESVNFEFEN